MVMRTERVTAVITGLLCATMTTGGGTPQSSLDM